MSGSCHRKYISLPERFMAWALGGKLQYAAPEAKRGTLVSWQSESSLRR